MHDKFSGNDPGERPRRRALRSDWRTLTMPQDRAEIRLGISLPVVRIVDTVEAFLRHREENLAPLEMGLVTVAGIADPDGDAFACAVMF